MTTVDRLRNAVDSDRIVETAVELINVPSPTRSAEKVADRLAEILTAEGFEVERPEAGWPEAPAVVTRLHSGSEGRTLQFDGHLDTVHLPFVPARVEDGILYGSGSSDMKGGIAAAIEALRILRDTDSLAHGSILLTTHDLHESPWGDSAQIHGLIDSGYVGDAVLLPEYLCDRLPVASRGQATLHVKATRPGEPVHEVCGGIEQPNVIRAGAEVVRRFCALDEELAKRTHPTAGRESIFVGQVISGEMYNQSPTDFELSGTRRWLPGANVKEIEQAYRDILADVSEATGVKVDGDFRFGRHAYELDQDDPLVAAFQSAHESVAGTQLPFGAKPFVDDGNVFAHRAGIPAITHGPNAKGAHTVYEECPVTELVRVALVYALTAVAYCKK